MEVSSDIDNILVDFRSGNLAADECFCLILSLIGYDRAKMHFLAHIEKLKNAHPKLHNQLSNVYRGYFESIDDSFKLPDRLDCSVENGFYAADSCSQENGFDADLEMALKLSLESAPNSTSNSTPSYADKLLSSTKNNTSELSSTKEVKVKKMTFSFTEDLPVLVKENSLENNQFLNHDSSSDITGGQESKSKRKRNKKKSRVDRPLSNPPVIYWFRRDLRLYDNPALVHAAQSGASVIPIFLWGDAEEGPSKTLANGGATKYWLHMALPTLNRDMMDKFNNPIIFRHSSNYLTDILDMVKYSGAKTLIINDVYEPYLKERDDKICKALRSKGIRCERFHSYLLHQPGAIRTESLCMRGMGSVTHFMECCRQSDPEPVGLPVDPPNFLPVGTDRPQSMTVAELGLGRLPKRKDGTEV